MPSLPGWHSVQKNKVFGVNGYVEAAHLEGIGDQQDLPSPRSGTAVAVVGGSTGVVALGPADFSANTPAMSRPGREGRPSIRRMVRVLLQGYRTGMASSRRIFQRLHEDIAFRVPAANNTPDFRTVSDFRKDHLQALGGLFLQALALCQQAGLVKLGHVALDGTKVRANASRNKAMSYGRMKEKEAQLSAEVAELLRKAGEVDDDEDRRYGKDKRGDELPGELAFRESR